MERASAGQRREPLFFMNQEDKVSKSTGLLVSILVRYPELATINYDPRSQTLKFTLMVRRAQKKTNFARFQRRLQVSVETLKFLEGKPAGTFAVSREDFGKVSVFEITRDVHTLTQEEISMLIHLFQEEFDARLVRDEAPEYVFEDDTVIQEEVIDRMLEDLKGSRQEKDLIAVREEGRVLVFDK